jgi:hypothetical protein
MKPNTELIPEFVELAPPVLEDGVIYISMIYGSAVHQCCCGCGEKVVTPFGPTDWKLIFDGAVSLDPSIGNWGFACKSHYFIRHNKVVWAARWSQKQINAGREHDALVKERYFGGNKTPPAHDVIAGGWGPEEHNPKESFWMKVKKWF